MALEGPERPIPNSYWVVPGRFAAGEYPGDLDARQAATKLRALLSAGIDHFVDLTEPGELLPYVDIARDEAGSLGIDSGHERFPVRDLSVPCSSDEMADILDAIDNALGDGKNVYLHCWGGVGRTGTVVGCWLVRHGRTGNRALGQLAEWWQGVAKAHREPQSPQTPEQLQYVRQWTEPPREEPVTMVTTLDRYRGCLVGLAAGDALGTTLEFESPGSFEPIDDMVGGGPFGLEPGQWTDDTSMALCLAASLIERESFDPTDQMERYVRWWREGYMSSTGHCFDIGNTVRGALSRFERAHDPYAGSTDPQTAGNGSLMRLAPVPMYYRTDPLAAISRAADSSRTTHGAREAVDACRYFAGLLVGALDGVDKETLLSPGYCPVEGMWEQKPLADEIARIADGSFKDRNPPEIRGGFYVVETLEAALWAFHRSDNFRDGALLAANLGHDADTTAAIYGQLAGAYYGVEAIPVAWREQLTMADEITSMADGVFSRASQIPGFRLEPNDIREVGTTTEESFEIAGVEVRWVSVIVSGHTVEQVLSYDVTEAEAVFHRPFDDAMDTGMRMAMYAADRIWLDETMGRVASTTSYVLDGRCVRTTQILHCDDIKPASAYWRFTDAEGNPVETEPWSCVAGSAPISHLELIRPGDALSHADEDALNEHIESYEAFLRDVWGIPQSRVLDHPPDARPADESTVNAVRHVTRPNGQRVQIDDQGWGLTKAGSRDLRYGQPIGSARA